MGKSLHRFLSFFLALFLAANLALPAGATEGWHIGMKANELTHFLKEGISVIKGRVISIKEMGMTDPESGNFQWFSPWPVNKMTVQVEEVLWGKLFRYQVTCETEADPAPGAEIVIRLQAPEESFAESRQWYLEYYSMEKHAQEYAYSDYEADWVLELNRDKFIYPAYNYFWSSEVEDLQTLRALLSGALQAPYPAESPDNQLSLYPSV